MASVDASNSCIPPSCPLICCVPPLPSTTRGEPCLLDTNNNNNNNNNNNDSNNNNNDNTNKRMLLLYGSGRLVVVRNVQQPSQSFVYRGHMATVTAAKLSPNGNYVASGDVRGKLRVWALDHEEHLCKLDLVVMHGAIRDIAWDCDGKRIAIVGERGSDGSISSSSASSECSRVVQWDTGVSCGELGQHTRGRAASCALRPKRPMRLVTCGKDDGKCLLHAGPPFARVIVCSNSEEAHGGGRMTSGAAVHCVRYAPDGDKLASVSGGGGGKSAGGGGSSSSSKSVCVYDGQTMELTCRVDHAHDRASLYACAWNASSTQLVTCAADGTVKVWKVSEDGKQVTCAKEWNVVQQQWKSAAALPDKTPIGGMQLGCAFVGDVPVSVGMNGQLTLFRGDDDADVDNVELQTGHEAPIAGLAIDQERGLLYTGDTDGVMVQWNGDGKALGRVQVPNNVDLMDKVHGGAAISCLAVVGDTVLSAGWDDTIRFTGPDAVLKQNHIALGAQPNAMATGTELVAVMTVGGLALVKDGAMVSSLRPVTYEALSICVSKDDSTVYVGGGDCSIHIYTVTSSYSLEEKHVIESGHLKAVHAVALSHDQSKLASADLRDVCVWDLGDDNKYTPLIGKARWCFHTQRITCLAWSPQDDVLASGGADDSIYLWSLAKKTKRVHYPFAHRGGVTGLEFLWRNKGLTLVSVGADACFCQWDVADDCAKKFG